MCDLSLHILKRSAPIVFSLHTVLIDDLLIFALNRVKFLLKAVYVLFSRTLHLFHDFLLSVQLSVKIFSFTQSFIDLMLEFQGLLL